MYGKIFDTVFTGTLYGSGPTVFAVWAYVISTAKPPGVVEINPKLLAGCIGTDVGDIKAAIDVLCAPDPDSRNPDQDGRRLLPMGGLQYEVVSFQKYRDLCSMEDKRAADRVRLSEKRASMRVSHPVADCREVSQQVANVAETETETETEIETEAKTEEKKRAGRASRRPPVAAIQPPDDVSPQIWNDWLAVRKLKRLALTETAIAENRAEAKRAGLKFEDALRICCARGWGAFSAGWDWKPKGKAPAEGRAERVAKLIFGDTQGGETIDA